MFYSIRHVTRFVYSRPVTENLTEARMQPRHEGLQRCVKFDFTTQPRARVWAYRDSFGNAVHHFDIPGKHAQLKVTAEATVETQPLALLPEALAPGAWDALSQMSKSPEHWDFLRPSVFVGPTPLLDNLAREWQLERAGDPLQLVRRMKRAFRDYFDYAPYTTQVDSTIDEALKQRRGVCQDFAHIMLALLRGLGIPARYVSGYLYHENDDLSMADATHAWVEAWLPEIGWLGLDPTNAVLAGERHIRTAVGRDYADVPPTKGVFKGIATSELSVGVQVVATDAPLLEDSLLPVATWVAPASLEDDLAQQQQQQQQ